MPAKKKTKTISRKYLNDRVKEATIKGAELRDRQWKIAQLAATLATRYPPMTKNDVHESRQSRAKQHDLTSEDRRLYISLVDHADMILSAASKKVGFINAGVFFDHGKFYSANEIAEIMKEAKWPRLGSEASIKKFMRDYFEECENLLNERLDGLNESIESMSEYLSADDLPSAAKYQDEYRLVQEQKKVKVEPKENAIEENTTYAARKIFENAMNFWTLKDRAEKRKFEISPSYLDLVLDSIL